MEKQDKIYRILEEYRQLQEGKSINKSELAKKYGVDAKSIQRDIENLRDYLDIRGAESGYENTLEYDRRENVYRLESSKRMTSLNEEVLAIAKILLDSRAFTKKEMMDMLDRLLTCCLSPQNRKTVEELIANERYHYIEPQHKKVFIDKMWKIGNAIRQTRYIMIDYKRMKDHQVVTRKVQPQAITFSEFYFYMVAYIEYEDKEKAQKVELNRMSPTIFRIDRIQEIIVLEEHFKIPYKNRFEEGEYRKRIQFMFGGKLQKTEFWCRRESIEAVLDRLPTAKVLKEKDGRYLISAETFGTGIEMWLRSQGNNVEVIRNQ